MESNSSEMGEYEMLHITKAICNKKLLIRLIYYYLLSYLEGISLLYNKIYKIRQMEFIFSDCFTSKALHFFIVLHLKVY